MAWFLRATLCVEDKVHRKCLTVDENQIWFGGICLDFHDGFINFYAICSDRDDPAKGMILARGE
jgi:hypothetical protein